MLMSLFLSFSRCQYVLHLHHSLSLWRPGHLRSSCADIADGSCLVGLFLDLFRNDEVILEVDLLCLSSVSILNMAKVSNHRGQCMYR